MANNNLNRMNLSHEMYVDFTRKYRHDGEQTLDFNDFIPTPEHLRGLTSWELAPYWDTKSNAFWVEWDDADDSVTFYTHWSAPEKIFLALSTLYPDEIIGVYAEDEGGNYRFDAEYQNGAAVFYNDLAD